mgnify:CR=1 FL=1
MEFVNAIKIVQSMSGEGWFASNYNMNIYRGCNQGCIYCDSRSSCYQITDFDKVKVKKDAPKLVEAELSRKRKKGIISMGGMSDPYNHLEKNMEYTRQTLESIYKYEFGVSCITKNELVLRDINLFKKIALRNSVCIGVTITTADDKLQDRIERNVSSSSKRFEIVKTLNAEGIYAGILMMPILPFINDTIKNIEEIVVKAHEAKAKFIYPSFGVTLRDNQRLYFFEKIGEKLTKKYIDEFGDSYVCVSPNHKKLKEHFEKLCKKYGISYRMSEISKEIKLTNKKQQISFDL